MSLAFFTSSSAIAQIETLVMPGPVIEGHEELETECNNCHQAFDRSKQNALCLDCHEDVSLDIRNDAGFHGLASEVQGEDCASCHTDHEGRDAEIVILNESTFDHELTDFPLLGRHAETACNDCHEKDEKHRDAPSDCFACHEDDNVHGETMGEVCADCHNSTDWLEVEFDHNENTDYPLIGHHLEAACLDCHEDQTFPPASQVCFDCHAEDDAHDGKSGNECGNCHSPTGWEDTKFNHNRDTDFPLDGKHQDLTCDDCHSDDPFSDSMDTECVACHLEDDNHDGHFGDECDTCHITEDWKDVQFDHDIDTNHPLIGSHEELECTACHLDPIFEVALEQSECNDCHAEDDPHEGTQGIRCNDCHNEDAWDDKVLFDHGLTNFPLLGNHLEAECEDCHDSHVFEDAETDCVSCHAEDDPHENRFPDSCNTCHNPVDWELWQFDHNAQTDFPLEGAHATVACESCHRQSLKRQKAIGSVCADCHRTDDVHDGEFGSDCGRCHTADSFRDVRSLQ